MTNARLLVSSSKTKPCQFGSVQLRRSVRAFTLWLTFENHFIYCLDYFSGLNLDDVV